MDIRRRLFVISYYRSLVVGIPNPEPFSETRVSGLESHQTRVSGRVWVWEDGDRIQVKPRMKCAACGCTFS